MGYNMSDGEYDPIPVPVVLRASTMGCYQDSNPVSTIVQLSFGDRLGALIDTMKALKDLSLDVSKGTVSTEGAVKQTKLFITRLDSGRKVEDPDMLEMIRLTIIDNLLKYHPESSERLARGEAFGVKAPVAKVIILKSLIFLL
ncbi:ACT domain-containing protein ACR12-like [Beta vulgaris subsp. vulgaris]|uniref:ACT domain-containing protein ACR12-like n=1 Tax=Beta vulgaris subsp. vulgaris TaxID=3555 RepID=UPI0020370DF3|nr:ACT domain-containing protein ACR12-like [Beta vulgaris subsp. vulgaris]